MAHPVSSHSASEEPILDYLDDPAVAAYFAAREHETYYRSLKRIDDRRAFHDAMVAVALQLLEVADTPAQAVLDPIIARSALTREPLANAQQAARDVPEGLRLLNLDQQFDFEDLRAAYRRAALRHHPDRGGSNEQMVEVNRAYERLHASLTAEVQEPSAVEPWGGRARTALDYLYITTSFVFEIALDDFALEDALYWLEKLTSGAFEESPLAKNVHRRTTLIDGASRLTERFLAAGRMDAAERALAAARVLDKIAPCASRYSRHFTRAEALVAGYGKPRFTLTSRSASGARLSVGSDRRTPIRRRPVPVGA